jgi:hypothetical protein
VKTKKNSIMHYPLGLNLDSTKEENLDLMKLLIWVITLKLDGPVKFTILMDIN